MTAMSLDAHRRFARRRWVGQLIVEALLLGGLALLVGCIFALVLFALGRAPSEPETTLLAFAALAAVVAALLWVPTRHRLSPAVSRLVHGERGPPEQALRVFEARLAQALPLEELLLGLAETLRLSPSPSRSPRSGSSTGADLERAASDPARPPARLRGHDGLPSSGCSARACVSGPAWAAVWLPRLRLWPGPRRRRCAHRADRELGRAPRCAGWWQRAPSRAEPFGTDEERASCAKLSRRVGLALRNLRLDSALQASLDELRQQAAELRASRARVSSRRRDAERRRIERDIHDGAQQQLIALADERAGASRAASSRTRPSSQALLAQVGRALQDALRTTSGRSLAASTLRCCSTGGSRACAAPRPPACLAAAPIVPHRGGRRLTGTPPELEATVYFCCLEALQNAAKHAGAHAQRWDAAPARGGRCSCGSRSPMTAWASGPGTVRPSARD